MGTACSTRPQAQGGYCAWVSYLLDASGMARSNGTLPVNREVSGFVEVAITASRPLRGCTGILIPVPGKRAKRAPSALGRTSVVGMAMPGRSDGRRVSSCQRCSVPCASLGSEWLAKAPSRQSQIPSRVPLSLHFLRPVSERVVGGNRIAWNLPTRPPRLLPAHGRFPRHRPGTSGLRGGGHAGWLKSAVSPYHLRNTGP